MFLLGLKQEQPRSETGAHSREEMAATGTVIKGAFEDEENRSGRHVAEFVKNRPRVKQAAVREVEDLLKRVQHLGSARMAEEVVQVSQSKIVR